jgi:hypothetical protein
VGKLVEQLSMRWLRFLSCVRFAPRVLGRTNEYRLKMTALNPALGRIDIGLFLR